VRSVVKKIPVRNRDVTMCNYVTRGLTLCLRNAFDCGFYVSNKVVSCAGASCLGPFPTCTTALVDLWTLN